MEDWLVDAYDKIERMPVRAKEVRERSLVDLPFFARLVNPGYMYGSIHDEIFVWLQNYSLFGRDPEQSPNKLILLPRAHLKSHIIAVFAAWCILKDPEVTILYISATAELAETQLEAIKNILASNVCRRYFPEYIHPQEGKRAKWSTKKITIDHEKRRKEGVRDATIATAGLTTNTTGWHADLVLADDLVIPENAYTEDGREGVSKKSSQFTSIRNAGGFTLAAGTRYHPKDIYFEWKTQVFKDYDDDGNLVDIKPVWEIKEHVVEEDGIYLWPRTIRSDGKAFGFDLRVLSRIEAEYSDRVQFYAQYYNDPNDPGSERISRDKFQYYSPKYLSREGGRWVYNGNRLNLYAAVDFAYSLNKRSDYTAIVVIGVDSASNYYILEIDRFKSESMIEYFKHIKDLHSRWNFNKLNAEVTAAQKVIVNSIKEYVKKDGLRLSVEEYRPSKKEGSKEERIQAALEHRYHNMQMWHLEGGWTSLLEDELMLSRPPHDDMKDALASAVTIAVPPARSMATTIADFLTTPKNRNGNRFGGINYR